MSWFTDLIGRVKATKTVDFIISGPLGSNGAVPLTDGKYVSVRVSRLRLPNTRVKVVDRVYGVVHAFAHLSSTAGDSVEFAATTMPAKLAGVDPKNLQNVITIDKLVVGPTPWSGGDFVLEIGLFSVVSENLAGPFLETMSKLSDTVGVAFAAAAKPYVDTIKFGVEALTSASGSVKLEIGLDKTFSPPLAASYALVAAPVGELDAGSLSLDPNDGKLLTNGQPYVEKPYLIFTVESSTQRADWGGIPELRDAYAGVRDAVRGNDQGKATQAFQNFVREAHISPDLIPADVDRLIEKVRTLLATAFQGADTAAALAPIAVPEFHELRLYDL
jgi:hypothetical protein